MKALPEPPRLRILKPYELAGTEFDLEMGTTSIGRQKSNHVVLQDALVSRIHAQIHYDAQAAIIEDLGGKNPIRLNGEHIQSQALRHGDHIVIGQTELEYHDPTATPTHSLKVIRDSHATKHDSTFEEDGGNISLDAQTVAFERPDLTQPTVAEKEYGRLSRLYRFSEELMSCEEPDDVFELLLSTATQEIEAERGFIGLARSGGDVEGDDTLLSLTVVRFWDPIRGDKAQSIEMSETIFNHITRQRRAVLVQDLPHRQDFGMSVVDLQIRSFICAPLVHGNHFIGLVYVDTRNQRDEFDRSDLEFVSSLARLAALALQNFENQTRLQRENERLRSLSSSEGEVKVIGDDAKLQQIFSIIEKVAPRDTSVLVAGENGTGKELIARAIHNRSTRKDEAFIAVNCGAIPPTLVESELFGHEKGAFTGADQRTLGKFEMANGGTLFLDEVGDMPLDMQVKILRALQERKFYRVGGKSEVEVDIRVISATNQDLQKLIEEGKFREDLFFRLAVVTLDVPPLRERGEDVITIAKHFLNGYSNQEVKITKPARECLLKYHWPGNIRELRNVLEQALILGDGKKIKPQDLPPNISKSSRGKLNFTLKSLFEVEKQYIYRVLEETGGNKAQAANILGIARETLYQKLKQYDSD